MDSLDRLYFEWLYSQIGSVKDRNRNRTYWSMARQLFTKEFVWLVPNDDNRLKDGQYLRPEFIEQEGITPPDNDWMNVGCSMLEMLVALSRWAAFEADEGGPREWFWHMIDNLQIRFNDLEYNPQAADYINDALDRLIFRNYHPDGKGGLFPLKNPKQDQRRIELWYQFNSYLLERE